MASADDVIRANDAYAAAFSGGRPGKPARQLAVLACMDARLDVYSALGLGEGDAHVIRNAGGLVTDDALRSLAISQRALGTREIVLVHHTQCGMLDFDDTAFRSQLRTESGAEPTWDVPGFADVTDAVRHAIQTIRDCRWLPSRDRVRGFVFDVDTGRLNEVV